MGLGGALIFNGTRLCLQRITTSKEDDAAENEQAMGEFYQSFVHGLYVH